MNTTTKIFDYNTKKFYCIHKKYKELCGKCAVELLEFRGALEGRKNKK